MSESPFLPNAVLTEGFDSVTNCVTGWNCQNLSNPVGTTGWFQGDPTVFPAQAGATNAYIGTNFNNTLAANTISNWLITPQVNFNSGAQLRFWTRTSTGQFPDRLEVRISSNGASTNVGATNTSVGDFTTTLITINPALLNGAGACPPAAGAFPVVFCEIVLGNAQGIPTTGSGRVAFRYFMPDAGPSGANSLYIGIDTFSYDDAAAAGVEQIYGITGSNGGVSLVRFPANAPASVTTVGTLTGVVAGHAVRAIDFRPANGQLYALSSNASNGYQLYTVNLTTAALTPVGSVGTVATNFPATVSMDFNPAADRLRVVTGDVAGGGFAAARSYRVNPNDGVLVAEDTALAYVVGDPNAGNNPPLPTGIAYDRNDNNPATATTLFVWDFRSDTLSRLGSVDGTPISPNSGQAITLFTPPVFLTGNAGLGFDVGAGGVAYLSYVAFQSLAARSPEGTGGPETFAQVNLATGALTVVGTFPLAINILDISAQLPVPPAAADLSATLADSPDPVAAGTNLSYTATATNNGPSPAAAVSISLPLPVGTSFVSASPSVGGTCSGVSTVVCNWVAATAPGAGNARNVVIVASVPAGTATGTVFNATLTVTTTTPDPTPANNSAAQATTVGSAAADLAITLSDAPDPVTAGSNLNYTAALSNGGPNDAQNVSITLPLPAGTSFVAVTASAGAVCNAASPVVCSWAGATIPGAVRTASITALVSSAQVLSLSATATAAAAGDPNPGNNTATAVTNVITSPNLAITAEVEPNATFATATALSFSSGLALGNHAITPAGDLDFWSATLIAGQRIWILTDTGGPQAAGATSTDTVIDLLAPDGTTVIENEDDDGTGTGGDGSVESLFASAIAGRTIAATGTHFIRVRGFNANDVVNPIAMFVARTSAADQSAEVEGNNTSATANPVVTGLSVRTGSIGVAADRDFYQINAAVGDVIYYSADADPERDGIGTDLVLELRAADGTTILQSVNSSLVGSLADPAAEGSRFNVLTTGTYYLVAAHSSATATGSYHLMVANGPPTETIYGITGPSAGASLIRFASNAPATVTTIGALTGVVAGHSVRAIDFRPADGRLYALSTNTTTGYQLYSVNLTTAALTPVGPVGTVATAFPPTVSMDFNPAADRLRVVTSDVAGGGFAAARSYRINPNDGVLVGEDTALAYVAGDPNGGNSPPVPTGIAYDRNDNNPATATTLFAWDFRFDTLSRVGSIDGTPISPNSGQLTTVFTQPVFLTGNAGLGFDVGAGAIAYLSYVAAPLSRGTGGPEAFSRINLATGAVTAIGTFPNGINVLDISTQLPVIAGNSIFRNGFE